MTSSVVDAVFAKHDLKIRDLTDRRLRQAHEERVAAIAEHMADFGVTFDPNSVPMGTEPEPEPISVSAEPEGVLDAMDALRAAAQ